MQWTRGRLGVAHLDRVVGGHRRGQGQPHVRAGDGDATRGDGPPCSVHRDAEGARRRHRTRVQVRGEGDGQRLPVHRRAPEGRQTAVHLVSGVVGQPIVRHVGVILWIGPGDERPDLPAVEFQVVPHRKAGVGAVQRLHGVGEGQRRRPAAALVVRPGVVGPPTGVVGGTPLRMAPAHGELLARRAGHPHGPAEGHLHPDLVAQPVGAVPAGVGGQRHRNDARRPGRHRLAGEALHRVARAVAQRVRGRLDVAHRHRLAVRHRRGELHRDLGAIDVHRARARARDGAGPSARRPRRHREGASGRLRVFVEQLVEEDIQVARLSLRRGCQGRPGEDRRRVRRLDGHRRAEQPHGPAAGRLAQRVRRRRRVTQHHLGAMGNRLVQGQRQHLARERHRRHRDRAEPAAIANARSPAVERGHLECAARRHRALVQGAGQLDRQRLPVHRRADLEPRDLRRRGARRRVGGPRVGVAHGLVGEARHLGGADGEHGPNHDASRKTMRRLGLVVAHLVRLRAAWRAVRHPVARGLVGQPEQHGTRLAAQGARLEVRAVDVDGPGLERGATAAAPGERDRHLQTVHGRAGEPHRLRLRGPGAEHEGERRGGQARRRAPPAREAGGPEKSEVGRRGRR